MNNPVKPDNPIVRYALYLEYECKCFYEGTPLRFQDMHIDHIIPKCLEGTEELEKKLKTLGLPEDFNINSIYNLVPCRSNINQVKNKNLYPDKFLSHCINMETKLKADKIRDRIEKLTKEYKDDKNLAKLTAMLNEYDNEKKLEELYNALSQEKPFEVYRKVDKGENVYTYTRSLSNVRLAGNIPLFPSLEGDCLITFSNLRLRDCMITLNHKQIMKSLFSGVNTDLDLKLRNYIIYPYDSKNEIYYVDLANIRIPLEREEVEQLTKIVDDFYDCYIKESRELYFLLSRDKFDKSDESNQIRLIKIPRRLWFKILKFCKEFDYDNGESEWNIFDSSGSLIKVYYKDQAEFKAFIFPEIEGSKYMVSDNEDVWLVWTDEFFANKKIENLQNNKIWSPSYAYKWLINELIPHVIYHYSQENKGLFKKKISYMDFKNSFNISDFLYIRHYSFDDEENILDFVTRNQLFYSTYHDDYYSSSDLVGLYESLKIIIEKTNIDSNGLDYAMRKLDIIGTRNKNNILNELDKRIGNIILGEIYSSYTIDIIFRCMEASIREYKNDLSKEDIILLKRKLNIFNEKRIIDDIRRKF